jgi:hypothetical protein
MYGFDHRGNPVHAGKVTRDFQRTFLDIRNFSGNYRNTPRIEAITGKSQEELNDYRKRRDFLATTDPRTAELLTGQDDIKSEVEEYGLQAMENEVGAKGHSFEDHNYEKEEIGDYLMNRHGAEYYEPSADGSMRYPQGTKIQTGFYPGSPREGQEDPRTAEQRYKALTPKPSDY